MMNVKMAQNSPAFTSIAGEHLHDAIVKNKIRLETLPILDQAVDTFEKELPEGKMDWKDSINATFFKGLLEMNFNDNPLALKIIDKLAKILEKHPSSIEEPKIVQR